MKIASNLIIVLISISFTQSIKATESTDLERCVAIKDGSKRLECFDNAIKNSKSPESNSLETLIRKSVLDSLKDPDSAKFGQYTQINEKAACITINARNGFGGYTGDQQAFLMKIENQWIVMAIEKKVSHSKCIEILSKQ